HFLLYKSDNFSNIYIQDYIRTLCDYLVEVYEVDLRKIVILYDIRVVELKLDIAIPCGLIINELVSNAMKHAFSDTGTGEITIAMHELKRNKIELIISDNGAGIPEDLNWRKTNSFGLQILSYMAEGQLEGKVKLNRTSGTEFTITFRK
ncbi:sensor histidine kinase, partial [Candidatus Latescibacterota bacterium]